MKDYIERMKHECVDLDSKIEKLTNFLNNNDIQDKTYLELCQMQLKYMLAYRGTLTERIVHESNKKY